MTARQRHGSKRWDAGDEPAPGAAPSGDRPPAAGASEGPWQAYDPGGVQSSGFFRQPAPPTEFGGGGGVFEAVLDDDPERTIHELREQIAEFETLLRVVPIGISIARDPECKVIISNRHHAALLGHAPDDNTSIDPRAAGGAGFRIYRDGAEMSPDELPMHRAIAERREVMDVECDVLTAGGERLTFVGHAAPLYDEQGEVRGAVGAFNNITDRKRAEERLAESERRYRKLAEENARLYEEARAAVALRDRFIATISHEMRAPLTAILGWTSILKTGRRTGERAVEALQIIERNALRQRRLVEDLLDASRIAAGKLSIDCRDLDFAVVVRDALETVAASAAKNAVTIVSDVQEGPVPLHGDGDRLHQVVCNLVSNAIKFAPKGEVNVVMHADDEVTLRVTDNGRGIDSDFLPHVFEQFRQGTGDRATEAQGLGLGLAIVRHLVELHGGRVAAESDGPGHGATFVVTLPRGERSAPLDREPAEAP